MNPQARILVLDHVSARGVDILKSEPSLEVIEKPPMSEAELAKVIGDFRPPRLVNGYDLVAMGLKPGPLFGRVLAAVEEAQLEGRLRTREEALKFSKRIANQPPFDGGSVIRHSKRA